MGSVTGRRRMALALALVAVSASALAACSSSGSGSADGSAGAAALPGGLDPQPLAEPTTLKVSLINKSEAYTPLFAADVLGEFAKENISIEYVTLPAADALPALAQGKVDASATGVAAALFNGVADGADIRLVLPGAQQPADGLYVRNDPATGKPVDFTTVATASGAASPNIMPVIDYLESIGKTADDVEFVKLPIEDLPTALKEGAVDAAWLNSPGFLAVEGTDAATKVADLKPGATITAYAFGPNLLRDRPEVGQAFVRALMRTQQTYLQGDYKADATLDEQLAKGLELDVDKVKATPSLVIPTTFGTDWLTRLQQTWIGLGDIVTFNEPLPFESFADTSFMDTAAKQG